MPPVVPGQFNRQVLVTGLSAPTAMCQLPDGRILVTQQGGQVAVIKNGVLLPTPFISLTVDDFFERGLLSIVAHPDFANNGFVYMYHTVPAVGTTPAFNRVVRVTAVGDVAQAGSLVQLFRLEALGAGNHNGGSLQFGRDGMLYVGVGENAVPSNAQSTSNCLGKLLRVSPVDGAPASGNPFPTSGCPRIWALGLRNPYTFAVAPEPLPSWIFVNDVGQNSFEEVNNVTRGGNYGWPTTEGFHSNPSFLQPVVSYSHDVGNVITGGTFYYAPPGAAFPFPAQYQGQYFFADFGGSWVASVAPGALPTTYTGAPTFATDTDSPVDLEVTADGDLLVLSYSQGQVVRYRFVPSAAS